MSKKYLKNENGTVRAITTDNLQLEKPLLNENYDIDVHNRNMDKIDSAIQEVKGKIDGLELVASNVKMADGATVEDTVSANKTSILNNTNLATQALNKANEAFQRGDNVKTQLVDKLISEGLDVSTNNTFEELINGIALGKKWASGVTTSSSSQKSFSRNNNTPGNLSAYSLEVSNLGFNPSFVYIYDENFAKKVHLNNAKDGTQATYFEYEGNQSAYYKNTSSASILPFWINVEGTVGHTKNGFCLPVYNASMQYTWIAYE